MRDRRCCPDSQDVLQILVCFSLISPNIFSASTSENPMMALSGVRSSCDMLARNSDLCRLAASSWALLSAISRKRRAFWIARADWVAKVFRTSTTSGENSPGAFRLKDRLPMIWSSRSRGTERTARYPNRMSVSLDAALVGPGLGDVGDLDRLAHLGRAPHEPFALPEGRRPEGLDEFGVVVVGGAQLELLGGLVVLEDRAAVGARQLAGAGDDRVEHRLDVQRRAHRPTDLAQRRQLLDRLGQLARPRLQLLEEADVLDGDDGLVGESLQQLDLVVGERPGLGARHLDDADGSTLPQHGDEEAASPADRAAQGLMLVLRIDLDVGYVDNGALEDRPACKEGPGWARREYAMRRLEGFGV